MKAPTRKVKARKNRGFNVKRLQNVVNDRPELYLKLFEDKNELLTDADLMPIFGVCRETLYRWRQNKILPFRKLGGSIFYVKQVICKILLAKSGFK